MPEAQTKQCQSCKDDFVISVDELGLYEKIGMPLPRKCFRCRMQNLFAFWAFGKFRKGKSDLSGKDLITVLPPKPRYPIYISNEWFSDAWDAMDFGMEYDPSRPFFDQLAQLQARVPRPHQVGKSNQNCDWCDDVWDSKNCYLCRSVLQGENLSYCYRVFNCKDSLDLVYCYDTQKSYGTIFSFNCFKVLYSFDCRDCIDSMFLFDCRNTQNSFMCWNLRNKQYHILNQPYSKEEYFKKLKTYNFGSRKVISQLQEQFWNLVRQEAVHRANSNVNADSSTGNYLTDCKNCQNSFYWESSQDCYNAMRGLRAKNCIDISGSGEIELSGNLNAGFPGVYQAKYSSWIQNCRNVEYLDICSDCEECFGCVGLKKKKYCILNKQYSETEYRALRKQIIAAMEREGTYGQFSHMRWPTSATIFLRLICYFQNQRKRWKSLVDYGMS